MTAPYVSVLITTFNRCALLCTAIDSVLEQDYPADRREIVVVDDGSTDDTAATVLARYGDRVRYLHKENGGINSACAYGFEHTRGEVIAQLDSDDWWYPDKLSRTVPLFERHPDVVAVFHDLDVFKGGVKQAGVTNWRPLRIAMTEAPCDGLTPYLEGNPVPAWTSGSLWRRSALMQIMPFPPGLWGFNDAYCARHILFFGKVCAIARPLGAYLIHTSNDYAGGAAKVDAAKLERGLRESKVMAEQFALRCRQFGREPSARRVMIQKLARAESHVAQHLMQRDRQAAARWVLDNDLGMPMLAKVQLMFNLYLPPRLAVFIKNRVIGRFVPLD